MKFHQSNLLKQFSNVTSAFTTKQSGNLAFHVGDVKETVVKNHKLLANELQYDYRTLVHMKQVHSNTVRKVTSDDSFENPPTCDALITDKKRKVLMVMVADCAPILFYDPKKEVIAVAHAGRAGAFKNIVQNVVYSFTNEYDSKPDDILVSIGSSIGVCCYEVGSEIYKECLELDLEYSILKKEQNFYLDISKILLKQLLNAGIQRSHIELSDECSACTTQQHYSYRAENKTGRFAGLIYLN